MNVRKITCKILENVEEGLLDPLIALKACLSYMSEDEVKDMAETYELIYTEDDE